MDRGGWPPVPVRGSLTVSQLGFSPVVISAGCRFPVTLDELPGFLMKEGP